MAGSFEFFDHTADFGLRVVADTLPELLQAAANGLYQAIGRLEVLGPARNRRIDLQADQPDLQLRDYLAELLTIFERDGHVATSTKVIAGTESSLVVEVGLAIVDQEVSELQREVKAITYHQLTLRRTAGGYEATFIVDV
ncbi:MAG: archease [bacterium]|nr:archease [bacterium]